MYINCIIELRHYIKKRKQETGEKGYILLYGCQVNRCHIMHRTRNSARVCLLPYSAIFYQVLLTIVIYKQCAAICGNIPSAATRNVLPYSVRLLLYFTKVRLYKVSGMQWEQVVVHKVSRGSPVTRGLLAICINILFY